MIRVLLVDDHAILRDGLRQLLSSHGDIEVAGEASCVADAVALARKIDWDVLVLDVTLPDGSGFDVLGNLKPDHPGHGILILSMHSDDEYAMRAIRSGASGYMTKESAGTDLLYAVRVIARGGRFLSRDISERLAFRSMRPEAEKPHERLSQREYQVFVLMARGRSVSEIAGELGLSVKTVSTHRTKILDKLQARNNADLIRYAVRSGLV